MFLKYDKVFNLNNKISEFKILLICVAFNLGKNCLADTKNMNDAQKISVLQTMFEICVLDKAMPVKFAK